jgi:hypothetical protein
MKLPTPQEVEQYAKTIDYSLNGEEFVNFYASKGWMIGKNKMKSWKRAVVTWKCREEKPKKIKLYPLIGKTCSECKLPAVYKYSGAAYDYYYCQFHMPDEVKKFYE